VRREQSLGGSSPASERVGGTGGSGGERGRGRKGVRLSHGGRESERVRSEEKAGARAFCCGAGRAGAMDVHAEGGAGAWQPWGARGLPRQARRTREGKEARCWAAEQGGPSGARARACVR
jgi:hypothetical protein